MELPAPGDLFEGQYEIGDILGEGGFARVFRARDRRVQRDVALKVISPRDAGYSSQTVQRFHREAKVVAALQNPHTITMFDYGESEHGLLWMAFEYVAGRDLRQVLIQEGPLPAPAVAHILRQVLESLREAHVSGILHRDIKPQNVLVYSYGSDPFAVKLLDFGIAKPLDAHTQITRTGGIVGTPRYMSPEQVFADEPLPASDLYSLGLVAIEMLQGSPAIDGSNKQEMMVQHVKGPPLVLLPELAPKPLRSIIEGMVARPLDERYASVAEVLDDLRPAWGAITGKQSESPTQPVAAERPRDVAVENRSGLLLFGMLAIAFVVFLIVAALWPTATPPEQPRADRVIAALAPAPAPIPQLATPAPASADDAGTPDREQVLEPTGCGKPIPRQPNRRYALETDLREREWLLYLPVDYDHNVRHSVILMLHGVGLRGHDAMNGSRLRYAVDKTNAVIVAPDAAERGKPWASLDDVDVVLRALDRASEIACVDRSRVMAVGHGPGGRFARELACEMPLSAIATMGDAIARDETACVPDPRVPMLRLFGKDDHEVPPEGGRGCLGTFYRSAKENDTFWIRVNQCRPNGRQSHESANGTCRSYDCAANYTTCSLDGGHDWPDRKWGMHKLTGCYEPPSQFDAATAIMRFFDEHGTSVDPSRSE